MIKEKKPKNTEQKGKLLASISQKFTAFSAGLSLRDQALFAKRLSLLIKAGVPLFEALNILKRQVKGANRKMFDHIAHDVAGGLFLSKSLLKFKNIFGDFTINIIKVGENSGTLGENLKYLAEEIDKKRELKGKVVGAIIYPAVILFFALAVSALMTLFLFPKLLPVFQSLHVSLPFTTRALIWLSSFLQQHGLAVLLGFAAAIVAFIFIFRRFETVRYARDAVLLRLPIIGGLFRNYHLTNITRTLGLLLKGQLRVLEAIEVAAETSTNLLYRRELEHLKYSITKGSTIAKHLEKHPGLFPIMITEMIGIGETTGNLSETLIYLAQICEQELDEDTKRLSSVIEPAMMIVMGLLVGFVAISIITPIYAITQHLSR